MAVSADALQVYEGLEGLTGAPTTTERDALEHRLVSCVTVQTRFSAGAYAAQAHAEIDGLLAAGSRPIVVGGTGLYLRAALANLRLRPPAAEGARERWQSELSEHGAPALHAELHRRAPWAAGSIDPHDSQRLVRALELSDSGDLHPPPAGASQLWTGEMRHPTLLAGLVMQRESLRARIDARVDAIVAGGAIAEVHAADAAGASRTARKALGFAELLDGDVDAMKRRTRNYARRQLTWMRKLSAAHILDVTDRPPAEVAAELIELAAPRSTGGRAG